MCSFDAMLTVQDKLPGRLLYPRTHSAEAHSLHDRVGRVPVAVNAILRQTSGF
jgi:hypothetical protein